MRKEYGIEFKILGEWYPCNKPGAGFRTYGEAMREGKRMKRLDGFPHRIIYYKFEGEKKELIETVRRIP